MQSLKDKLLKAGLVTEEAAKKAEAEKKAAPPRRDERPPREARSFEPRPERTFESSRLPKFAPLPGSKEAHRLMAKKQLKADKALRERVLATQVPKEPGATPFHFVTRKNKLRRLELSEAQAKALESGALAVVERPDPDQIEHALVPAEVAKELLGAFPRAVRFLNSKEAAVGFLSETEISSRAHEAQSGETGEAHDEPDEEPSTEAAAAQEEPGETWITVKRAPKP
jgi:uncharacterized protein YaiL (DUF2058 family)